MNFASDIPMSLRDMYAQLTSAKKLLTKRLKQAKGDPGIDLSELTADVARLATTMTVVGKELRAWEGKVRKSVAALTNEERFQIIVRFLEELPPGERVMFADTVKASKALTELWNQPPPG